MAGPSHRSDMYSHFSIWLTFPALLVVNVHRIGAGDIVPHGHSLDANLGLCLRSLLERHVDAVRLGHVKLLARQAFADGHGKGTVICAPGIGPDRPQSP